MDKISFVTVSKHAPNNTDAYASLQKEISAFMTKFPIPWELIISNQNKVSRAENLWLALQQAQGEYIVVIPADLSTPLGDAWSLIRELALNPNLDLILGNRMSEKKKYLHKKNSWHLTLENIILEKFKRDSGIAHKFADALSPYWALRKSAFNKMQKLQNKKVQGWYYTPEIIKLAEKSQISIAEFPILSQKNTQSSIPLWREYFRHLL